MLNRGAAFAYRIALWYPELVSHLFTVCVPYARPMKEDISLESLVQNAAPHFAYQLQFKSGEVEKFIRSKSEIRQFLLALYGGRTEAGEVGFDAHKGVLADKIGGLKPSRLLTEEVGWNIEEAQSFVLTCHRSWSIIRMSLLGVVFMARVCCFLGIGIRILTCCSELVSNPRGESQRGA